MQPLDLPILYRDEALVAVSKPSGLLVHRSEEARDRRFLLQELAALLGRYLHPVHRIDRGASGIVAFALSGEDARLLQGAMAAAEARKEYLALVRGEAPEEWTVERPLTSDDGVVQPARTSFRTVERLCGLTLVQATLHTGRRHQIRRHLSSSRHQVIGDSTHGKGRINRELRERFGLTRLFLHAARLEIRHPRTGDPLVIEAPLPAELVQVLERLRREVP